MFNRNHFIFTKIVTAISLLLYFAPHQGDKKDDKSSSVTNSYLTQTKV